MLWWLLRGARDDESGQGMVEYALIIALVAVALIAILSQLQGGIQGIFQRIIDALSGV